MTAYGGANAEADHTDAHRSRRSAVATLGASDNAKTSRLKVNLAPLLLAQRKAQGAREARERGLLLIDHGGDRPSQWHP